MRGRLGRLLGAAATRLDGEGHGTTERGTRERGADGTIDDAEIWRQVAPFTMTSPERVQALVDSVRHLELHRVDGALVECGVWRGGSMMAAALALSGAATRDLYLFDTFDGMPTPGDVDVDHRGVSAAAQLADDLRRDRHISGVAHLDEVRRNMASTGYPGSRIHYVAGRVEDTVPAMAPDRIALLRLDTDWYESTRHELQHLFPRLVSGGILIIDDYGHWQGARRAVDEYFAESGERVLLTRIDYTGRIAVAP